MTLLLVLAAVWLLEAAIIASSAMRDMQAGVVESVLWVIAAFAVALLWPVFTLRNAARVWRQ